MSSELKPCPFCGNRAVIKQFDGFNRVLTCLNCGGSVLPDSAFKNDVIRNWNMRYERPCYIAIGNRCSECKHSLKDGYNYCPNCGAKVTPIKDYERKRAEHGRYRDGL